MRRSADIAEPIVAVIVAAFLLAGCSLFPSERYGIPQAGEDLTYKPVGVTPAGRKTPVLTPAERDRARADLEKTASEVQAIPPARIQ